MGVLDARNIFCCSANCPAILVPYADVPVSKNKGGITPGHSGRSMLMDSGSSGTGIQGNWPSSQEPAGGCLPKYSGKRLRYEEHVELAKKLDDKKQATGVIHGGGSRGAGRYVWVINRMKTLSTQARMSADARLSFTARHS